MADDVELFAALRPELEGAMLHVAWTDPDSAPQNVAACLPWPWAICGVGNVDQAAFGRLLGRPVIWFWLGPTPAWVPPARRAHGRWRDMLDDVRGCLERSLGGVTLAPNRGLIGPRRELVLSPGLEALLACSPAAATLTARDEAAIGRVLARHHLPLALVRERSGVRVELAA